MILDDFINQINGKCKIIQEQILVVWQFFVSVQLKLES